MELNFEIFKLEAFPVDNGWSALIILLLGDPHLLEGGEGGKDGSSNPDRVLSLWWGNDLDLDGGWSKSSDLLLHPVSNTRVHGGTSRQDNVGIQVLTNVHIALHDGVVGCLMNSYSFHSQEGWLEESLWTPEPLIAYGDDLAIRKFVGFFKRA